MAKENLTHGHYRLMSSDEKFYFLSGGEVLEINRLTLDVSLISAKEMSLSSTEYKDVYLLMGIVNLLGGPYLIVSTKRTRVGKIENHEIFEASGFEIIPFTKSKHHLSDSQEKENQTYLSMIRRVLDTPGFYYSNSYDLTHSMQRRHTSQQTKSNFSQLSLYERADERFVWNGHILRDLVVQPEMRRFTVPVIHGYVSVVGSAINGKGFSFVVISRRSTYRAGVRYFMRGVDDDGHVANYVETEQIIIYRQYKASFVQTRGSIPLHWSQRPTLKYKPKPLVKSSANQLTGMQKHFDEQIVNYGQQVVINLIDQKGSEKHLGETFKNCIGALSSCLVEYNAFDFHKECSKMRWDRLSILINRLDKRQTEFSYFTMVGDTMATLQKGVFRTNCIDCLDRTNVVQSMLAKKSLLSQLQKMGVMTPDEKMEDKNQFNSIFMNVWADNADYCAKQYAGTGALKTDFTRTGKRTTKGLMNDGYNSLMRYFYNNFSDGFRQDSINLFLGNYVVNPWDGNRLQDIRSWRVTMLPIVVLIGLSMLFMSLIMPSTNPLLQLVYVLFWGVAVMITVAYVYKHGEEFVNQPRLLKVD